MTMRDAAYAGVPGASLKAAVARLKSCGTAKGGAMEALYAQADTAHAVYRRAGGKD